MSISKSRIALLFLVLIFPTIHRQVWGQPLKEMPADVLKPGDQAPPLGFAFMVQGPSLNEVSWETLRGKVVVLEFWGSWCAPCVAGIPHLNELVSLYKGKAVQFIAVGHENPRKVAWFLKRHPIEAWVALDTDLSVYKAYSAFGIPYAVVVDQKGSVAAVLNPKNVTEAVINTVLAGRAPAYPQLSAENYWNPETAAEYFLKVGQEEPPAQ